MTSYFIYTRFVRKSNFVLQGTQEINSFFLQIKEEHYEIKLQVYVELITKLKSELFV